MRQLKRNTKLWQYLYNTGILDTGNDDMIKTEIKKYYRKYDRELKQDKRAAKRTFTISFPNPSMGAIRANAKHYSVDVIDYIKLLVQADITHTKPLHQTMIYKEILQVLQFFKNEIQDGKDKKLNNWFKDAKYELLEEIILKMEQEINSLIAKHS